MSNENNDHDDVNDEDSFIPEENHMIATDVNNDDKLFEVHNNMIRREKELLLYHDKWDTYHSN
jgi:hypothetical protein